MLSSFLPRAVRSLRGGTSGHGHRFPMARLSTSKSVSISTTSKGFLPSSSSSSFSFFSTTTTSSSSSSPSTSSSPTSFPPRPFRVLGVQQIAIGNLDKSKLSRLWVDVLGLAKTGTFRSEKENVDEDILRAGPEGPFAVEIDIMAPIDAAKSPRVHEPSLNHIGLWVDDLKACETWCKLIQMRIAPGGIRKGAAGYDVMFLHPKGNEATPFSGEGVLIELVQAPKDVIAALGGGAGK